MGRRAARADQDDPNALRDPAARRRSSRAGVRRLAARRPGARGALAVQAADLATLPDDPAFRAAFAGFLDWASRAPAGAKDMPPWDWGPAGRPDTPQQPADAPKPSVTLPRRRRRWGLRRTSGRCS